MESDDKFFSVLKNALDSDKGSLPIFNAISLQIQLELIKKEPNLDTIEKLIVAEQSLSSTLLRVANSVRYCGLVETTTVKAAIIRMGMSEILRIVSADIGNNMFSFHDVQLNAIVKKLWQHSVGCAFAAGVLSTLGNYGVKQDEAFSAGLFHDIGKLHILKIVTEKTSKDTSCPVPQELLLNAIESFHAQEGYRHMKRINMPKMYALVTRDHHLEDYDLENRLLVLVKLANALCHQMGIGLVHDPSLEIMATQEALKLNLAEADLDRLKNFLLNTHLLADE